jgi:hypothetical protein
MDDYDYQNTRYTVSLQSSTILELYQTARISTISLTYFHYCLQNGNYTVNLHFAEIQFTKSHISTRVAGTMLVTTYNSLGRRIFDIYVQVSSHSNVKLTFFLKLEARTTLSQERLVWKSFNIEDEVGSAEKPDRGVYGPIISAISVFSGKLYVWHLFSIIQLSTMHVHMIDLKPVPLC